MKVKSEELGLAKEWRDGISRLEEQGNGEKLSKKTSGHPHTFIKNADSIQQITVLLGIGTYGKVKKTCDQNGRVSVIKIEQKAQESEYKILKDLGLSSGRSMRKDKQKTYTQMEYLGPSVYQLLAPPKLILTDKKPLYSKILPHTFYLYSINDEIACVFQDRSNTINEIILNPDNLGTEYDTAKIMLNPAASLKIENQNEKLHASLCKITGLIHLEFDDDSLLELAIDICLALAEFHERGYAHLDLKPKNITVDSKGQVHLIDFGFSETNPEGKREVRANSPRGTPLYLPNYSHHSKEGLSRIQFDMIALKRVLFFDLEFYSKAGISKIDEKYRKDNNVLTQDLVNKYQLGPYLITQHAHHGSDTMTARTLAAVLIAAKLGLSYRWYKDLDTDMALCKMLTDFYSETKKVCQSTQPQLQRQRQLIQVLDSKFRRNDELENENQRLLEEQYNTQCQLGELTLDFAETMGTLVAVESLLAKKEKDLQQFPEIIVKLQNAREAYNLLLNSKVRNTYTYSNRWHFLNLSRELLDDNSKYENLRGDQLKLKILENLRMEIQQASTFKEIDMIKSSFPAEIKLLKQKQGVSYFLFGLRTGAMDVLEKMLEDRREELLEFQAKQEKQEI